MGLTEERAARIPDLAELGKLFTAWAETVYHVREHPETGPPPLARREAGGPFPLPAQADLAEAFRWPEWRTVSRTALVSLHGSQDQVGPALARRRVELAFDPFDLTVLFVRRDGKDAGTATPRHITRHSHPRARPEDPVSGDEAPRATGVGYIALTGEQHDRQQEEGPVSDHALMPPAGGHGGAPACGQPGREQGQGQDGLGAGQEDGRG